MYVEICVTSTTTVIDTNCPHLFKRTWGRKEAFTNEAGGLKKVLRLGRLKALVESTAASPRAKAVMDFMV